MDVLTSFPERFEPGSRLHWSRGPQERLLTIRSARSHGRRMLLSFDELVSPQDAGALSGGELAVRAEEAVPPPAGFYYSHEIAGWRCENPVGVFLGEARALEQSAAGPLLLLENAEGKEVLVPFVWPIVADVDRETKRIVLDPPEGLMDL